MAPDDDDDDRDPLLDRRRRRKREAAHRRRLLLVAALAVAAAGAVGGVFAWGLSRTREADDGKGGGPAGTTAAGKGGGGVSGPPLFGGPSAGSEGETWDHQELAAYLRGRGLVVRAEHTHHGSLAGPANYFFGPGDARAYVQKWPNAQAAKDQAGSIGPRAFSWGRFFFRGDADDTSDSAYLASMRTALGVR